jgi:hypothetical protein
MEFGVAGGNGLVALEIAADHAERRLGTRVEVAGFDTGSGLPPPLDERDTPYVHHEGDFPMDEPALRARLQRADLVLGLVRDSVRDFVASGPPPIGFLAFDLDYYSSTMDALSLFEGDSSVFMPRVLCYFDDVLGYPWAEFNGERLAINEFNQANTSRRISRIHALRYMLPRSELHAAWPDAMYVAHVFDHPRYNEDEGVAFSTRLDLTGGN